MYTNADKHRQTETDTDGHIPGPNHSCMRIVDPLNLKDCVA